MVRQQGNLSGSPYSETHSFATGTHNDIRFMPWESRHHKLSRNTTFTQIQYLELGQPNSRNTTKISQSARKLPITTIQCTTFLHSIFPILTMSFWKVCTFSKRATLSTTRFFQFVKRLSKLIGIFAEKLGKIILNVENNSTSLFSGVVVFCIEVRIV